MKGFATGGLVASDERISKIAKAFGEYVLNSEEVHRAMAALSLSSRQLGKTLMARKVAEEVMNAGGVVVQVENKYSGRNGDISIDDLRAPIMPHFHVDKRVTCPTNPRREYQQALPPKAYREKGEGCVCQACGRKFGSEAGRDRHFRKYHLEAQSSLWGTF